MKTLAALILALSTFFSPAFAQCNYDCQRNLTTIKDLLQLAKGAQNSGTPKPSTSTGVGSPNQEASTQPTYESQSRLSYPQLFNYPLPVSRYIPRPSRQTQHLSHDGTVMKRLLVDRLEFHHYQMDYAFKSQFDIAFDRARELMNPKDFTCQQLQQAVANTPPLDYYGWLDLNSQQEIPKYLSRQVAREFSLLHVKAACDVYSAQLATEQASRIKAEEESRANSPAARRDRAAKALAAATPGLQETHWKSLVGKPNTDCGVLAANSGQNYSKIPRIQSDLLDQPNTWVSIRGKLLSVSSSQLLIQVADVEFTPFSSQKLSVTYRKIIATRDSKLPVYSKTPLKVGDGITVVGEYKPSGLLTEFSVTSRCVSDTDFPDSFDFSKFFPDLVI